MDYYSCSSIVFFFVAIILVHSSLTLALLPSTTPYPFCKDYRCSIIRSHHQKNNSFYHRVQFATTNAHHDDDDDDDDDDDNALLKRRKFLTTGILSSSSTTITAAFCNAQYSAKTANAIDNPLKLKGTFWETGQLYQKSNTELLNETTDFLSILQSSIEAFHSSTLLDTISDGNYSQTLRLLRGGLISESKIRLSAYALIDLVPEEEENNDDDDILYKCNQSFRIFLRYFDVLDKEVELASRPLFPLGSSGVGEGDVRIELLTRVGEVEDALKIFVNNVKIGLGE